MPFHEQGEDDITLPFDGAAPNSFVFIGSDDPLCIARGVDSALVFHFGNGYGFMISVDQFTPDNGYLRIEGIKPDGTYYQLFSSNWDITTGLGPGLSLGYGSRFTSLSGSEGITLDPGTDRVLVDGDTQLGQAFGTGGTYITNIDGDLQIRGREQGRGRVTSVSSAGNTAGNALTEVVTLTLPSTTYAANRHYEVIMRGGVANTGAGGYGQFNLRKTNTAGQQLADFYRYYCPASGGTVYPAHGTAEFCTGASAITAQLVLTIQSNNSPNLATHFGNATSPRTLTILDIGPADPSGITANLPVLV